jgi:putative NADH-flavin reductase
MAGTDRFLVREAGRITGWKNLKAGAMNVYQFGATGRTGQEILKRLLEQGHTVKALVRSPERLKTPPGANLKVIHGDVLIPETFASEMEGIDVVVSTLGTGMKNKATTVYSRGGQNILEAMRRAGVKKLVLVTSALVDRSDPGTDVFFLKYIIRPIFKKIYADMALLEGYLDSVRDVDWVCVRPTGLNNKKFTGEYRVSLNHVIPGHLSISRADLADFLVKQLTAADYVHRKPVVAN